MEAVSVSLIFLECIYSRDVSLRVSVLYTSAIVMYLYSALPSKHIFSFISVQRYQCNPAFVDLLTNFKSLPLPFAHQQIPTASTLATSATKAAAANALPPFPSSLRGPTLELASSHLICSVALTGVLLLQAGRWWAEQHDNDDDEDEIAEPTEEKVATEEPKRA